jgi:hypothetical protein
MKINFILYVSTCALNQYWQNHGLTYRSPGSKDRICFRGEVNTLISCNEVTLFAYYWPLYRHPLVCRYTDVLVRLGTLIYVVNAGNSRLIEKTHISYTYILSKPGDQVWKGTSIYAVDCGNPATWQARRCHLSSDTGNPKNCVCMFVLLSYLCPHLAWKLE